MTEVHQLLCEGCQKVFKTLNLVAPSPPPLKKKKERKNRSHYLVKNHVDPWICEKKTLYSGLAANFSAKYSSFLGVKI